MLPKKAKDEIQFHRNSELWFNFAAEMRSKGLLHADFYYDYEDLLILRQAHPGRHICFEKWIVEFYDLLK